jgi:hypothetical protein
MVFESVIFSPFGDGSFLPNGRLHKNSYTLTLRLLRWVVIFNFPASATLLAASSLPNTLGLLMIVNWDRLLRPLSLPVFFILAVTLMSGLTGLIAVAAVHFLVSPQSKAQFMVSVLGFGAFGLFASLVEVPPPSIRASVSRAFANRPLTFREKVLWVLAIAVMVGGLALSIHHAPKYFNCTTVLGSAPSRQRRLSFNTQSPARGPTLRSTGPARKAAQAG